MTNFNFEIPNDTHTIFKIISIKKKQDMQDILNELIKNYVNKNKKSLRLNNI